MLTLSRFLALTLFAIAAVFTTTANAQMLNCGPQVSLQNGIIVVEPGSDDDTDAIQCALESAGDVGVTTVKLTGGSFAISSVMVEDFEGTLEGQSKSATTVFVLNESVDCDAVQESGRVSAALKFINGNVKVAKMTLAVDEPCATRSLFGPFIVVHFTGSAANSGCESETGFGQVDRVDLFNSVPDGGSGASAAVAAFAEGVFFETCRDTQLGTFKLNRSLVDGFPVGIDLSLRGGGQVDVNFSHFINNETAVLAVNANQLMTVQSNDFFADLVLDTFNFGYSGVQVQNFAGPTQNRAVVYNNDFLWEGDRLSGVGARFFSTEGFNLSAAVTNNRFESVGDNDMTMVLLIGLRNASIAGNRFRGGGFAGVDLFAGSESNVISGNDFSEYAGVNGDRDVYIAPGTVSNIVGPFQAAEVDDRGTNNIVLGPQSAALESAVKSRNLAALAQKRLTLKQYVANAKTRLAEQAALKSILHSY